VQQHAFIAVPSASPSKISYIFLIRRDRSAPALSLQCDFGGGQMSEVTKIREIASAVVFDTAGYLLLQLRDNIPGILYPGKVGLFGGHREGQETFLDCVVREVHEELSFFVPPDQFDLIAKRSGPNSEVPGGTVRAEFFVTRNVPVDRLVVTEGQLKIIRPGEVGELIRELTPSAVFALKALGLV
jgi:8-oxo-dGTP diphosphatase